MAGIPHTTILAIAKNIGNNEKLLALTLELQFTYPEYENFKATNHSGGEVTSAGTTKMLFKWREKQRPMVQARVLSDALKKVGLVEVADVHLSHLLGGNETDGPADYAGNFSNQTPFRLFLACIYVGTLSSTNICEGNIFRSRRDRTDCHSKQDDTRREGRRTHNRAPTSAGERTGPRERRTEPREEWIEPREEWIGPREKRTGPREKRTEPREEWTEPREEWIGPREKRTEPREKQSEPRQEWTGPREEWTGPRENPRTRPREKRTGPREEWTGPRENPRTRPREKRTGPREERTGPREERTGPREKRTRHR